MDQSRYTRAFACVSLMLCLAAGAVTAGEPALMRIDRAGGVDRDQLLAAQLPLVAEMQGCFLALGDREVVTRLARERDLEATVLDAAVKGKQYAVAGLRPGWSEEELGACGEALWYEEQWVLLRGEDLGRPACTESSSWLLTPLRLRPIKPGQEPPDRYQNLGEAAEMVEVNPLVADMVADMTNTFVVDTWTDLVNVATTRYSTSTGCVTAAYWVRGTFDNLGLSTELQTFITGYAPNVIGTLEGVINPDEVYIVVGHLDDLPSSGLAPGADDNASGSATVVALAKIMADYRFASTVKFIAVTGEEQGLRGSDAYAERAATQGENILGVLNADMTGWAGDGLPASGENLDLNYNSTSQWLALLFVEAAADYNTGCIVDAFSCPSLGASDHAPFWDEGWSALCGITDNEGYCSHAGHYPYYHQSNDTIANCGSPVFYATTVRAYLATLAHLAEPLCKQPSAPIGLSASADGDNSIALSWTQVDPGVSYEIYRAPGGCAGPLEYTAVGTTTSTGFVDSTASGGVSYAYVVRAKDSTGYCLSDASNCAQASTTGDCIEPPRFAGATGVNDEHGTTCTLTVSWSAVQELYCGSDATFTVYRSQTAGFAPNITNRIASGITGTSYIDQGALDSHVRHYYIVHAVDSSNGAEDDNTVEVSGVPTGPSVIGTWTDDVETYSGIADAEAAGWSHAADLGGDDWSVSSSYNHTTAGSQSFAAVDAGSITDKYLITPPHDLTASSVLSFWHRYQFEGDSTRYDGGVLEISTDGGGSWIDLGGDMTSGGYNGTLSTCCSNPLGGRDAWTADQTSFGQVTVNLGAYAGSGRLIRWRMGCDSYVNDGTWAIDDIEITEVDVPGVCVPDCVGPDADGDGVPDACDLCPGYDDTIDSDGDEVPDGCDLCPGFDDGVDTDGDGVPDGCDICSGHDDTVDTDGDGVPNGCDLCPGHDDTVDSDTDGVPDGCDACPGFDDNSDADGDGVPDGCDTCPGHDDNADSDLDGVPNGCDICPGYNDTVDTDDDGVPNGCDLCPGYDDAVDSDSDGVPDGCDACPGYDDNADADADGVPDGCDICPGHDDTVDSDSDGVPDGCDICPGYDDGVDSDADGVPDGCDLCPGYDDTVDSDSDGVPDGCDLCPGFDDTVDSDTDGVPDGCDICPGYDDLADSDTDGVPDGCDLCPGYDDAVDSDTDGVPDGCDACPGFDDAVDTDADGVPDGCDLCLGDDSSGDGDSDGVCADLDCDDDNGSVSTVDRCGVCGGDGGSCVVFADDFELGDTTLWSVTTQ